MEIENLYTLRVFNAEYLDDYFEHMILLDGNDPRGIDVGVLIRRGVGTIAGVRTHIDDATGGKPVKRGQRKGFGNLADGASFSRDCLEIDVAFGAKTITVLANHFKSQDGKGTDTGRRLQQAERAATIVNENIEAGRFPLVMGDLNYDPLKPGQEDNGSLAPLVRHERLADPLAKLPDAERWTHFYESERDVSRLDYILLDKRLAVVDKPEILRKGLSTKCKATNDPRYPTIGPKHTEASDHCPVTVTIEI